MLLTYCHGLNESPSLFITLIFISTIAMQTNSLVNYKLNKKDSLEKIKKKRLFSKNDVITKD